MSICGLQYAIPLPSSPITTITSRNGTYSTNELLPHGYVWQHIHKVVAVTKLIAACESTSPPKSFASH
jgi:hypothetical protein